MPSKGRVLVVDDEPLLLQSYCRWLAEAGFEVAEASGGREALRLIENDAFDFVLSDTSMPEIDGLALLRRVRARVPELPVVLMLDTPDNRAALHAKELGALESLFKPLDAELLKKTATYAVRFNRSRRGSITTFRNRRGEELEPASFTATEAKNEFGRVLELVTQGRAVVITKHDAPKAILISVDEFNALSGASEARLDTLSDEFDALLARMQTPKARRAMKRAFDASPKQLGKAALGAARTRG